MRTLARPLLAAALMTLVSLYGTSASAQMKMAVVDVQRAVMQTEDGLRAQATLKKLFDSRQQELNKRQTDLQKQKEEIDKQKTVLSQQALQKKVDEWQKEMVELQTTFVEYNKELEKKQKELTDPIFERVLGRHQAHRRAGELRPHRRPGHRGVRARRPRFDRSRHPGLERIRQRTGGRVAPGGAGATTPRTPPPSTPPKP